jgi:uncharacterized membrane protein
MSNKTRPRTKEEDQSQATQSSLKSPPPQQARKNVETIMALEEQAIHRRTSTEHAADVITKFAGSTPFLLFHLLWFAVWISANTGLLPGIKSFDPYPFSFLTLVVSLEAIFLSLLVLMAQNRMTKEADKRAHLDLQINMLAEQQNTLMLKLLQKVCERLEIDSESDEIMREMAEETDVHQLAEELEEKLPNS